MVTHRILFVGLSEIPGFDASKLSLNKDEELANAKDLLNTPTLYDYHIVVLYGLGLKNVYTLTTPNVSSYYKDLATAHSKKDVQTAKKEFQTFLLKMPGVLVVFPIGTLPKAVFPVDLPEVEEKVGEVIIVNDKHPLSAVLRKFRFGSPWHLQEVYQQDLVIAKNNPGLAVSYEVKLDSGARVFFLPFLLDAEKVYEFLRMVLNVVESNYRQRGDFHIAEPKWAAEYLFPGEEALRKQVTNEQRQLDEYKAFRGALFSYGEQLSYSVYLMFRKIGFGVRWKEREGRHDIEIDLGETLGIVEVKGLKGTANIDDLRQLLDHYMEGIKGDKEVKGVFVLDHFREVEPKKRGDPFTKDAIRIAEGNNFCLMTTVDLFDLLVKFIKGELDTTEITKLVLGTRGKITN